MADKIPQPRCRSVDDDAKVHEANQESRPLTNNVLVAPYAQFDLAFRDGVNVHDEIRCLLLSNINYAIWSGWTEIAGIAQM